MCFLLLRSFSPVLARKISSQHQTSTAPFLTCGRNRATPALPCSLLHFPTSTPKPRAEGRASASGALPRADRSGAKTKSFCPCQKRETSVCLSLFFRSNWGQASARGACRASPPKRRLWRMQRGGDGAAVGDWQGGPAAADRAGYRKRACEASSSPSFHFRHVMEDLPSLPLLYSSLSHPPPTLQHPERTRFRLFRAFPGAFSRFPLFWTCKISRPVFVYSAT